MPGGIGDATTKIDEHRAGRVTGLDRAGAAGDLCRRDARAVSTEAEDWRLCVVGLVRLHPAFDDAAIGGVESDLILLGDDIHAAA